MGLRSLHLLALRARPLFAKRCRHLLNYVVLLEGDYGVFNFVSNVVRGTALWLSVRVSSGINV